MSENELATVEQNPMRLLMTLASASFGGKQVMEASDV